MPQNKLKAQKLQAIRDLAAEWGKAVAEQALSGAGSDKPMDFQAMEQIAAAAAAGLTQGTIATLLEQQAKALNTQQPCPECGQLCSVDYKDRTLAIPGDQLRLHEPVCQCPACRREFFPPAMFPASGQPQLQSQRPAEDR